MRVGIDLTALLPRGTGVDTYLRGLVTHLDGVANDHELTAFVNVEDRGLLAAATENIRLIPLAARPRAVRLGFQQALLPAAARMLALDVVHSPAFLMPMLRGRARHLVTIYDMTFFSLPRLYSGLHGRAAFRRAVLASIRHSDRLSVPSDSTRASITEIVPEVAADRVRVIRPGISPAYRPRPRNEQDDVRRRLGLPARYVLHVGTQAPRKNLTGLVGAFEQLTARGDVLEHLVLAGRAGDDSRALRARIASSPLRDRVHELGYVAQDDLPALYSGASLFVFPSIHEGFGFPPLEAMACGAPTIASNAGALSENLDGAAELVAPGRVDALADAMRKLLRDDALRESYRREGVRRAAEFSWEEAARQTLACYDELAASSTRR